MIKHIVTIIIILLKVGYLLCFFYIGFKSYYVKQKGTGLILYLFVYYMFIMLLFAAEEFYFHSIRFNYYVVNLANLG